MKAIYNQLQWHTCFPHLLWLIKAMFFKNKSKCYIPDVDTIQRHV